ncbi:MAG TPA: hypothetical protein PKM88_01815 [bacterium]|nr:hypothetical protein [bacterium]
MRTTLIVTVLAGALLSVTADLIGLGDGMAFGRLQLAGTAGGLLLAAAMPWLRLHRRRVTPSLAEGSKLDRRHQLDRRHHAWNQ